MSTISAPSALIDQILAQPHLFYVNIHSGGSGGFPTGAVRDQLADAVPEPGSLMLLGVGALGLLRRRRA